MPVRRVWGRRLATSNHVLHVLGVLAAVGGDRLSRVLMNPPNRYTKGSATTMMTMSGQHDELHMRWEQQLY